MLCFIIPLLIHQKATAVPYLYLFVITQQRFQSGISMCTSRLFFFFFFFSKIISLWFYLFLWGIPPPPNHRQFYFIYIHNYTTMKLLDWHLIWLHFWRKKMCLKCIKVFPFWKSEFHSETKTLSKASMDFDYSCWLFYIE